MEVPIYCYLISEVASHHFCHILFVRNRSLGPAHIQEEEVTQRCEYQAENSVAADDTEVMMLEQVFHGL